MSPDDQKIRELITDGGFAAWLKSFIEITSDHKSPNYQPDSVEASEKAEFDTEMEWRATKTLEKGGQRAQHSRSFHALRHSLTSTLANADVSEETRLLIDDQLRQAGWIADSQNLRYSKGTRPEKSKNMAIAEWPTESGPADYMLFVGLTPMAPVEAKRKNVKVSASLVQAKRYSRGFKPSEETQIHPQNWGAK